MIFSKSFYLMRHGESVDNALGLISGGGRDPELTLRGLKQAEMASLSFLRLRPQPTKIVTSGLRRAQHTASIVSADLTMMEDPDLNERHLGELDGLISEAEQMELKILPGEESKESHRKRVIAAINRHLDCDDVTLFVCHGGTVRRIFETLNFGKEIAIESAVIYKVVCTPNTDSIEWSLR